MLVNAIRQQQFENLMLDKFLGLALPVGATKDHPITCPMGTVAPPLEGLKLPPVLLCVAEMEYYEAMKKANKDVELFVSKGMTHSFYLNKIAVDMDPNFSAQTNALIFQGQGVH
ncbi:carboxylesterase 15 [Spatholobus suberectus]|nr:carboxylesterase 15 [Spatholobus suberectus]